MTAECKDNLQVADFPVKDNYDNTSVTSQERLKGVGVTGIKGGGEDT